MQYNFDEIINRRESDSIKWNVKDSQLPMWIADMDFKVAPEILEAIKERVEHGVFGYNNISDQWYEAICEWWKTRHNFSIEKESLIFCSGIVPAISSIVRKITTVGENVLVQTPVYNMFFNSITNNGRNIIENRLLYDGEKYTVDFEDLEKKLSNPQTTLMILCNPHNPVGCIWSKEILEGIGKLCKKYNVVVISDEIHCDLTNPGYSYIPFASVSKECLQNSITCIAPSKTFNIAGLQTAAVMVPNEQLRHRVKTAIRVDGIGEANSFAIIAAIAAYTKGTNWLDALREYLFENKQVVREFLSRELPNIKVASSDATYLLWIDCTKVSNSSDILNKFIIEESGLYLISGSRYGESGNGFLRMNIACPRQYLIDGLNRLKKSIVAYEKNIER